MPPRKYQDLAHLSPEEYKIQAEKRRTSERSDYRRHRYLENKDQISAENKEKWSATRKERLEKKLTNLLEQIEKESRLGSQ
jgi:hypothetical protein